MRVQPNSTTKDEFVAKFKLSQKPCSKCKVGVGDYAKYIYTIDSVAYTLAGHVTGFFDNGNVRFRSIEGMDCDFFTMGCKCNDEHMVDYEPHRIQRIQPDLFGDTL